MNRFIPYPSWVVVPQKTMEPTPPFNVVGVEGRTISVPKPSWMRKKAAMPRWINVGIPKWMVYSGKSQTKMVYQIYIVFYPQGCPLMVIRNLIITDIHY